MRFARPLPDPAPMVRALGVMGWSEVVLDQRMVPPSSDASSATTAQGDLRFEWGPPCAPLGEADEHESRWRFIGRLQKPLRIVDREAVRWAFVQAVGTDPLADLGQNLFPFPLRQGGTYEILWTSRLRQSSRASAYRGLEIMGFRPLKICAIKKNMRLAGLPGANSTLWYGFGIWDRADSIINAQDPFFFEDVRELA